MIRRQNIGQVLDSKANLVSYCHEVQKKLGMQYRSPPVPIDLRHSSVAEGAEESEFQSLQNLEIDDSQVQQFRQMAQNKYNIRLSWKLDDLINNKITLPFANGNLFDFF